MTDHLALITDAGNVGTATSITGTGIPVGAVIMSALVIAGPSPPPTPIGTDVTGAFGPVIQLPIVPGLSVNGTPESGESVLIQNPSNLSGCTVLVLYSTIP
jgi:hypothetical protein